MDKNQSLLKNLDWKALLLENYRDLMLTENQVMLILMCDLCINNGETLVTPDALSLKMTLDFKEIDKLYAALLKKGFISIVDDASGHQITSLDGLKSILLEAFLTNFAKKKEADKPDSVQNSLFATFENRFGRPLTYIELETIQTWLDEGNSPEKIIQALDEAMSKRIENIRYIDKILLERRQAEEFSKEGATTISKNWRNNLEETQKIIGLNWVDKDDKDK
ncbi:MAG: DnaD domain protein [Bacilli bacterium]|nr:DnaD domain protein [Bacilli bacterium]MDD3422775.1 DnaD domain protein [Bacilli bacterium]MDD4065432.1 DnaD domain protein [Bacilli bacterium]